MPDNSAAQDISYQPKTKGFSYAQNPGNIEKKKPNIFFTLGLELFGLLFLFFVFLLVLNYFNVISLNRASPTLLGWLPKNGVSNGQIINQLKAKKNQEPQNISDSNEWLLEGTFEKYDQKYVYVKYSSGTLKAEYSYESEFYTSKEVQTDSEGETISDEGIRNLEFPSNVLAENNIGHKASILYRKEKDKNFLETITVYR